MTDQKPFPEAAGLHLEDRVRGEQRRERRPASQSKGLRRFQALDIDDDKRCDS